MDLRSRRSIFRTAAVLLVLAAPTGCGLLFSERSLEESFRDFVLDSSDHLHETASAVNRRDGLSQEAWMAVRNGDFQAAGLVKVEVTLSSRPGREVVEQLAVLPSAPEGIDAEWVFRDESRSLGALLGASRILFDGMMRTDDRVMNCARGLDPSQDRAGFHECATGILEAEFGVSSP